MSGKNNKNHKQDLQITEIQTNMNWVLDELKDIKSNHLTSIYNTLGEIKNDLSRRPTWLITGVFSALVGLAIYLITS